MKEKENKKSKIQLRERRADKKEGEKKEEERNKELRY